MLFSQILGQEKAKRFLKQVMASKKVPHAYLFTGIPGIGKTSTAKALAMALNCNEPVSGEGCGHCQSCRQMRGGNFPDFLSIKPDGQNIKIDQMRDLNRRLSFAPVMGKFRVSVIYHAKTMTDEAANSFLKTLEEPPSGNILILNTTEPRDLLPTIVSRCQRVPFQPLAVHDMANWLVENRHLTEESAIVLSRISGGSLGRALKMCDGDFLEKRQEWLSRLLALSGISKEKSLEMALECASQDKNVSLDISEDRESGMTDMLATWETWYRDLLLLSIGGPDYLLINVDFSHKLKKSAGSSTIQNLVDSLLAVDKAQRDLRRMRNPALVMEHTVLMLKRLAG